MPVTGAAVALTLLAAGLNRNDPSRRYRSDRYFTLALGFLDTGTGAMSLVQAGHPHPLVLRADGRVEFMGSGGLPVGLIDGAEYERFDVTASPRRPQILIYSDGLIECPGMAGEELERKGPCPPRRDGRPHTGLHSFRRSRVALRVTRGTDGFPDECLGRADRIPGSRGLDPRAARNRRRK